MFQNIHQHSMTDTTVQNMLLTEYNSHISIYSDNKIKMVCSTLNPGENPYRILAEFSSIFPGSCKDTLETGPCSLQGN